jgi:hypothetical protein
MMQQMGRNEKERGGSIKGNRGALRKASFCSFDIVSLNLEDNQLAPFLISQISFPFVPKLRDWPLSLLS